MPRRCRLLIVAPRVVQYQAPLYRELAGRRRIDLRVGFIRPDGAEVYFDPHFGREVRWDVDLLKGYDHAFLPAGRVSRARALVSEVKDSDVVVVHGHRDPWMLWAACQAKLRGTPYLLRGESWAEGANTSVLKHVRHVVAGMVTRGAAGAMFTGQRNLEFYERYGQHSVHFAPYSVDNERFAAAAVASPDVRSRRLDELGLRPDLPTLVCAGKMIERKRPLDVVLAARRLEQDVNLLFIGDGPLLSTVRKNSEGLSAHFAGFVNQSEMPELLSIGDVIVLSSDHEPWGLVINEAMLLGLQPVVSDRVGCAPDLVDGIGHVYRFGDIGDLAKALATACREIRTNGLDVREAAKQKVSGYSVSATADGFESAALAAMQPLP